MRTIVCCGVGGVGKTTLSTALALFYSQQKKVMLITIDPAKRLQDALKIQLHHQPQQVLPNLDACMLDAQKCFDDLVEEIHPKKQEMLNNRYYQFASRNMGGIQEFMAVVLISKIIQKDYDIIIIDTPPSRNALSFLRAPNRMKGLFEESILRYLVSSKSDSSWKAMQFGMNVIAKGLRQFLGTEMISDMSDFFSLFQPVAQEMTRLAYMVDVHLRNKSEFFYITSPFRPKFEIMDFYMQIKDEYRISQVIMNYFPPRPMYISVEDQKKLSIELQKRIEIYTRYFDAKYNSAIEVRDEIFYQKLDIKNTICIPYHHFQSTDIISIWDEYQIFFPYFNASCV